MSDASRYPRCDQTPSWLALSACAKGPMRQQDIRQAFVSDPDRARRFTLRAPHLLADLSKNLWNDTIRSLLVALARECRIEAQREAMWQGQAINTTEHRSVGHVWLRSPEPMTEFPDAATRVPSLAEIIPQREAMLEFAEQVRADGQILNVVNIGIGGSDLGSQMACGALQPFSHPRLKLHFASNVDHHEIHRVLEQCSPGNTLFLISSKTFTSAETMANAHTARQWFLAQGGEHHPLSRHFVALTANAQAARDFGIETIFGFWDWVGGRFSVWSAAGLPLAIALGRTQFLEFLAGAHAMDRHFAGAPLQENLPVQLALLDIWYRNFHEFDTRCIAPYLSQLQRLPAYLQQLEMESNGKGVDHLGHPLEMATSPVIFGEPGTNCQHAYFQMLHQASTVIPVEIIACRENPSGGPLHHRQLLSNALAQARALMLGQDDADPHRRCPGNRPSSFVVLDTLRPDSLGALLALYEHRTFVCGALWGINSFDQWGVQLGKVLARDIESRWDSLDATGLDASTANLLRHIAG
jgi:glucose-6-phosphate isomerase